jgi:pimeloyl-ACP methyl ester carboxylesterase
MFHLMCPDGYSQEFQIGHTTTTFVDGSRGDRNISAEIYYPADSAGDDVAITATEGAFPVLAFGHGFVMDVNAYENIWSNVVPRGFIMVLPKTEGGILPSHLEFAKDLAFVINEMQVAGQDPTSLFYNRINAASAVMGHSMGAGAAILAATLDSNISALAVLAPVETNPSAIDAAGTISIPSLIFAGSNDCVTPPATNQIPMYDALPGDCKTYISITGASHCQMANSNLLCTIGEITCSPSPDISRDEQHEIINNYLADWLASQLKEDCTAGSLFDQHIMSDPGITFQKNCLQCEPLANVDFHERDFYVYPNPFSNQINVFIDDTRPMVFTLYDFQMRKVTEAAVNQLTEISLPVASGIFFYTIKHEGKLMKSGKLVRQ